MLIKFSKYFLHRKRFNIFHSPSLANAIVPLTKSFSNYTRIKNYNSGKYEINFDSIFEILTECKLEPKMQSDNSLRTKYCPLCEKSHNDDPANMNTFTIYKSSLIYFCFRCGNKGHVKRLLKILSKNYDLQQYKDLIKLNGYSSNGNTTENEDYQMENQRFFLNKNNAEENSEKRDILKELKETSEELSTVNKQISHPEKKMDNFKISLNNSSLINELYKRNMLMWNPKCSSIVDYLTNERKLSLETLKFYKVGVSYEKFKSSSYEYINLPCVTYPIFYPTNKNLFLTVERGSIEDSLYDHFQCEKFYLSKLKIRAIGKEFKHFQRVEPPGAVISGLFGLDTVPEDAEEIIITEGEYDAMAAFQVLKIPSVSLPNGASNLPTQVLPYFQRFKRIYLWMDADQAGQIAAQNFSKKLGENKTFIINTMKDDPNGPKDANDALKVGKDFNIYIQNAKPLSGDNIIKMADIKSDILQFLSQYDQYSGYKSTSFSFFNSKLKGLRMGEFSIFTGETGSGKTTFLSQLSLDFLKQRVPTLWGSFEIKNDKLASLFLMQYAKRNLRLAPVEEIEYYTENFEKLPLYMLKFHGSQNIDEIINSMNYAVYNYDIQNIVLDNLQFMIGLPSKITNKFDFQDEIVYRLRKFVTEKNVHLTLVIHPRKDDVLKISSIFGTGKASQEADNIYILQSYKGVRILEIAKNRFDGTTGKVAIGFDQTSCRFFELTLEEFSRLAKDNCKLDEIIDQRKKKFGRVESEQIEETSKDSLEKPENKSIDNEDVVMKSVPDENSLVDSFISQKEKEMRLNFKTNGKVVNKENIFESDTELFNNVLSDNKIKSKIDKSSGNDILSTEEEFEICETKLNEIQSELYAKEGSNNLSDIAGDYLIDENNIKPSKGNSQLSKLDEGIKSNLDVQINSKSFNNEVNNIKVNTNHIQTTEVLTSHKESKITNKEETLSQIKDFQIQIFPKTSSIETFHTDQTHEKTTSNALRFKPNNTNKNDNRVRQSTFKIQKNSIIDDMF